MSKKDMIGLVIVVAVASILVRLAIANRAFGETVNTTSAQLF